VVLFSGFPIAWGLTLVAVVFLVVFKGPASLAVVATQFMDELNSFALLTIPLFILLGAAIGVSAAGKDIYIRCTDGCRACPAGSSSQHPRLRDVLGRLRILARHGRGHRQVGASRR